MMGNLEGRRRDGAPWLICTAMLVVLGGMSRAHCRVLQLSQREDSSPAAGPPREVAKQDALPRVFVRPQ